MEPSEVLADRYVLGDVIGRGGTADVHRAHDLVLDRDVAVKLLRDPAGDAADRARFVGEARTLAVLNHPGLVVVLDTGISRDRPFLVMELVAGATLSRVIARGPTPGAQVARIGRHVAEALSYVHGRGVVHRDVKPGNVLIGADDRVKLADFGIARLVGDTVRHTQTGHTIGTAAYLAPEQVLGSDLTAAADIYSLGLVLLETLTGVRAFPGTPTEAALARVNAAPMIPVSLSPRWQRLLRAMTAREAVDRPTAAEVAAELQLLSQVVVTQAGAADAGETTAQMTAVRARPTPLPIVPRRRAHPGRALLAIAAATTLLALVGGLVATSGPGATADPVGTGTGSAPADRPTAATGSTPPVAATTADAAVASGTPTSRPAPQPAAGSAKSTRNGKAKGPAAGPVAGPAAGPAADKVKGPNGPGKGPGRGRR